MNTPARGRLAPHSVVRLQRTIGNRAVQDVIERTTRPEPPPPPPTALERLLAFLGTLVRAIAGIPRYIRGA
ncbi:MAG: hypothetical protein SFV54_18190 [Bryobacteraceae bacterium]|nr:hypothetical protein [Bryobacteraceae bacterium]